MGKSVLAMNMAYNVAKTGGVSVFYSLEMSCEELFARLLCNVGHVSTGAAFRGRLSEGQWKALYQAVEDVGKTKLFIDNIPSPSLTEIRAKLMQLKAREGRLDLAVIDYLQLMRHNSKRSDNRNNEIGEITRGLKVMAKDIGAPILLISQLNLDVVKNAQDARPKTYHLRDSGNIEQDADIIMLLQRDADNGSEDAILHMDKVRNGEPRDAVLKFEGEYSRFVEVEQRYQSA